jgi:AraC-like DNA-binding protein
MVVKSELEKLGLSILSVDLGEVEVSGKLPDKQIQKVVEVLNSVGFALIENKKSRSIEKIKTIIISLIYQQNNKLNMNLSEYLSRQLAQDYSSLSHLFSEVEGVSIEKYFILQKIERVKELLIYDEMNLNEIADLLQYSSVAYLSNQFKKVIGYSPSNFKQLKEKKRQQIDGLQNITIKNHNNVSSNK